MTRLRILPPPENIAWQTRDGRVTFERGERGGWIAISYRNRMDPIVDLLDHHGFDMGLEFATRIEALNAVRSVTGDLQPVLDCTLVQQPRDYRVHGERGMVAHVHRNPWLRWDLTSLNIRPFDRTEVHRGCWQNFPTRKQAVAALERFLESGIRPGEPSDERSR